MKAEKDIRTFLDITKIEKYWKYFEVKACALNKKKKNLFLLMLNWVK
jgi:hypothetical protein